MPCKDSRPGPHAGNLVLPEPNSVCHTLTCFASLMPEPAPMVVIPSTLTPGGARSPTPRFAVLYTFSNLLMIARCTHQLAGALHCTCKAAALTAMCWCSTMFLMGPLKQLKSMFDKGRVVATLVYLAAMALTLISAIYVRACSPVSLLPALWCCCSGAVKAVS